MLLHLHIVNIIPDSELVFQLKAILILLMRMLPRFSNKLNALSVLTEPLLFVSVTTTTESTTAVVTTEGTTVQSKCNSQKVYKIEYFVVGTVTD